jgi:hypothetical protein
MLMLRKGGGFAGRQIRKYFTISLLCLGLALTILLAKPYVDLKFGGFLIAASTIVLFKTTFRRWCNWLVGKRGEEAVAQALEALSNDYALLNDLTLPGSRGNVDHVLIGSNGLFAIETKNYSGFVKCDGDRWFVGRRAIHSLSKQAKRNSMAIRASLTSLHAEKGVRVPYVTPLLVFVDRRARLKLFHPTVAVLRLAELVDFVRNTKNGVAISNAQKHAIVRHLQSLQSSPCESSIVSASHGS